MSAAQLSAVVEIDAPGRTLRTWGGATVRQTPAVSVRVEFDPERPEEAVKALSAAFTEAMEKIYPEALRAAREAAWDEGHEAAG